MKEQNVIGTMQLLAACQQAPRLRKLVRALLHRRVRGVVPRPGRLHRGHRAARGAARRVRPRHPRHRGVRPRVPPPPPRRHRDRAALRAVHRLGRRHHADPLLRPAARADRARPRPAPAVRAHRRRARGAAPVGRRGPPRHVQRRRRRACSRCPRRSGGPAGSPCRCSSRACPAAAAWPAQPRRRRVRPGPGRPLRARPGGRHHRARSASTASRRAPPPEAFDDFIAAHASGVGLRGATSWPPPSGRSSTASGRCAGPYGRRHDRRSRRPTRAAAGWSRVPPPVGRRHARRTSQRPPPGPRSTRTEPRRTCGTSGSPPGWRSCAAASPATTRSTSSASTPN